MKLLKSKNELNKAYTKVNNGQSINILDVSKFNNNINIFWNNIKDNYFFITEKSQDFLNWRYCDRARGQFKMATGGDMLKGEKPFKNLELSASAEKGGEINIPTMPNP